MTWYSSPFFPRFLQFWPRRTRFILLFPRCSQQTFRPVCNLECVSCHLFYLLLRSHVENQTISHPSSHLSGFILHHPRVYPQWQNPAGDCWFLGLWFTFFFPVASCTMVKFPIWLSTPRWNPVCRCMPVSPNVDNLYIYTYPWWLVIDTFFWFFKVPRFQKIPYFVCN